jgi:hypothetical protein
MNVPHPPPRIPSRKAAGPRVTPRGDPGQKVASQPEKLGRKVARPGSQSSRLLCGIRPLDVLAMLVCTLRWTACQ